MLIGHAKQEPVRLCKATQCKTEAEMLVGTDALCGARTRAYGKSPCVPPRDDYWDLEDLHLRGIYYLAIRH